MATHHFQPTVYHTTIGPHEPVLSVADGDTVITTTVDNAGRNASDQEVTPPGNPQTGPFYVKGAAPGDTLAVRFDRLIPNRRIGRTLTFIAPHVLDPDYIASRIQEDAWIEWQLNLEEGTATLPSPPFQHGSLTLRLEPMLGCFGTAPAGGQYISTTTASRHGGNMDYRGFAQGVTVYLPVFTEGALFHMGDGHAEQGHGEIVGTGIEVSFEVHFTVRLLKGKTIHWPRAETADHILTVGNARPLDQALQHATTEMVYWLEELGLKEQSTHILLGQFVEYEVGNVFDPAYTMVCKVKKSMLQKLGLEL